MLIEIEGQQIVWNVEKKLFIFNIIEPFYHAGNEYGWDGNQVGIGIGENIIKNAVEKEVKIAVWVGNNSTLYYISPEQVVSFCAKYMSFHKAKDTLLYVIRWSEFSTSIQTVETIGD